MKIFAILRLIRPWQWIKNLMLFFPPFLSGALFKPGLALEGVGPFTAFCLASSATYIVNDLMDCEADSLHPRKKNRPLPAGIISPLTARILAALLFAGAVILSLQTSSTFVLLLLGYLCVTLGYSLFLKHWPIFDLFCISTGFVLRLYAGGEAFGVVISEWLFLTVFLLAMFLSLGKRASEQRSLGQRAGEHRKTLAEYPEGFLEGAMFLSGAVVLVTYAMYAINTPFLVFSVPICMFGLLRYLLRVRQGGSGDPSEALIRDVPLLVISLLWVLVVGWSVYR